MGEKVW